MGCNSVKGIGYNSDSGSVLAAVLVRPSNRQAATVLHEAQEGSCARHNRRHHNISWSDYNRISWSDL